MLTFTLAVGSQVLLEDSPKDHPRIILTLTPSPSRTSNGGTWPGGDIRIFTPAGVDFPVGSLVDVTVKLRPETAARRGE